MLGCLKRPARSAGAALPGGAVAGASRDPGCSWGPYGVDSRAPATLYLTPLGVLPCAANPHPADAYAFLRGPRYWADPGCDHNLTRVVSLSSTFPNAL